MKNRTRRLAVCVIGILVLAGSPAVSAGQTTGGSASRADQEMRSESVLEDYKASLDELDQRMQSAAGSMREELNRAVDDTKHKHRKAAEQVERLRKSTNEARGETNKTLQRSVDELQKALENARITIDRSEK
jgi:DNA anti-recombination protein RmuC